MPSIFLCYWRYTTQRSPQISGNVARQKAHLETPYKNKAIITTNTVNKVWLGYWQKIETFHSKQALSVKIRVKASLYLRGWINRQFLTLNYRYIIERFHSRTQLLIHFGLFAIQLSSQIWKKSGGYVIRLLVYKNIRAVKLLNKKSEKRRLRKKSRSTNINEI